MTLPSWLSRSLTALALFAGLVLLATFVSRTRGGEAVRPPPVGLPRTPDYHALLVDERDSRRLWLGTHVGLYESRDGGRSWRVAGLEGQDVMKLVESGGKLWATGHNVFATSADGGKTWSDVRPTGLPSLDIHGFAIDPRGRAYAAVAGEGLFVSDDDAKSFTLVSRDAGPAVYGLAAIGDLLAGDAERGLVRSDDGGRTWRQTLDAAVPAIAVGPDADRLIATGEQTHLSTDGGRTWDPIEAIDGETWPAGWSSDGRTAYVVTLPPDRQLYRSDDGGRSWRPVVQ